MLIWTVSSKGEDKHFYNKDCALKYIGMAAGFGLSDGFKGTLKPSKVVGVVPDQSPVPAAEVSKTLRDLISLAQRHVCMHEETHRGGLIWEICDQCGAKWADDEGGKPKYKEPEEIVAAEALLEKLRGLE